MSYRASHNCLSVGMTAVTTTPPVHGSHGKLQGTIPPLSACRSYRISHSSWLVTIPGVFRGCHSYPQPWTRRLTGKTSRREWDSYPQPWTQCLTRKTSRREWDSYPQPWIRRLTRKNVTPGVGFVPTTLDSVLDAKNVAP